MIFPEAGQNMCSTIVAHWRILAKDVCSDSFMINHYCFRCGFFFLWLWHNSTIWRTGLKNLVSKLGGVAVRKGCQPHDTAHSCSLPSPSNEVVFHIPPGSFINKWSRKALSRLIRMAPKLYLYLLSVRFSQFTWALVRNTATWKMQWVFCSLPQLLCLGIPSTLECLLIIMIIIAVAVEFKLYIFNLVVIVCKCSECMRLCKNQTSALCCKTVRTICYLCKIF